MALALIVLAIGSVAAGYIGIPHALGGHNALARWLEPRSRAPVEAGAVAAPRPRARPSGGRGRAHDDEHVALELTLMGVSSAIAIVGIGIAAAFIWLQRRDIADAWRAASRRCTGCC